MKFEFMIDDIVTIENAGYIYTTYKKMASHLGVKRWAKGKHVNKLNNFKIRGFDKHFDFYEYEYNRNKDIVVWIEDMETKEGYLFGYKGIRLLSRGNPFLSIEDFNV